MKWLQSILTVVVILMLGFGFVVFYTEVIKKDHEPIVRTEIFQVEPTREIPVFEVASWELGAHDIRFLDEDKFLIANFAKIGVTTLVYEYDWKVRIGTKDLSRPTVIETELHFTEPTVEILSVEIIDLKPIRCYTSNGWINSTITFDHLFANINGIREDCVARVSSDTISSARKSVKEQFEKFYEAVGFTVVWD